MKPLKPVMAALLAASSAVSATANMSSMSMPVPADAPADCPAKDETNPVNILSCIVHKNPEARKDIGARFARFVESKDPSGQYLYLNKDFQGDKGKALLPNVESEAKAYPGAMDKLNKPGDVAVLYFVAGPDGDLPQWAKNDPILAKALGTEWSQRLQKGLADKNWTGSGQIAPSNSMKAVQLFLVAASSQAWTVFADQRKPGQIEDSVKQNETRDTPPPVASGPGGNPLDSTGSGFSFNDLYREGAVVRKVWGPNDKGFREISMKIYSTKDPVTGQVSNKIGIVDITANDSSNPSLPQFVNFSANEGPITFHDGGRKYTISVTASGDVTLKRADAQDDNGALKTSVAELSGKRDAQIESSGVVTFGGKSFHVLGQGGEYGSVMFFPIPKESGSDSDRSGGMHPALMADVTQVNPDGNTERVKVARPDLGRYNGDGWHLEFDSSRGLWKVVKGEGDKPAPPKASGTADQAPAAGQTPGQPGQAGQAPAASPKSLDEAIAAKKADGWAEEPSTPETQSQLRIMSKSINSMKNYAVAFDPSLGVSGNAFQFAPLNGNVYLRAVRAVKGYVVLEYSTGDAQYYNVANFAQYLRKLSGEDTSYEMSGSFVAGGKQIQNATDVEVAVDILVRDLKVSSSDSMLDKIRARVQKNVPSGGYVINGNAQTIYLGFGETGMTIWPEEKKGGDTGSNAGLTGLRGPGTAVQLVGSADAGFPKTLDTGGGHTAQQVKEEKDIALYSSTEDENVNGTVNADTQVWFVMFNYKQNKKMSRSGRLTVFGGKDRLQLPAAYHMKGLSNAELPASAQLMLLYGSTQEKGAIAVYRNALPDSQGANNIQDRKANCAGPLIWWGELTEAQVRSSCESDSKVP